MALFPPQLRDWQLPSEAPLTPHALRRVCREAAVQPFQRAAEAINEDWQTALDAKQLQRWVEPVGLRMAQERDAEAARSEAGQLPDAPANPPRILAVSLDGGRIQMREKNTESGSRWREDKVAAITSYLPGKGEEKPQPLTTTYVATLDASKTFGRMARVEAERRGMHKAKDLLVLGDGGNWIDPVASTEFAQAERILDWYHAAQHLHDCAKAVHGPDTPQAKRLARRLETHLWHGRVERVTRWLQELSQEAGSPRGSDPADHPRRILQGNIGYFRRNGKHMDYPRYRRKGWPIGSGNVEAGIKQFNKRVKGTDQFWQPKGAEAMLCLRAKLLCQDDRWRCYWANRTAYLSA
jgi:hypothetical protein